MVVGMNEITHNEAYYSDHPTRTERTRVPPYTEEGKKEEDG